MDVTTSGPVSGRPLLLLHGGGLAGWMWDPVRRELDPSYREIVPDLPGHGRSRDQPYRSHTETLEALTAMPEIGERRPLAVVGFSLGAQLAVELAARRPELVDRVMIISAQATPVAFPGLTVRVMAAAMPLARRRWFARLQARQAFVPPSLLDQYVATSASLSPASLLAAVEENLRYRPSAGWSAFGGPASIMVGARERGLMRRSAAALHAAAPGSELEVVAGCGHGIPLQRPAWLADRIGDWLSAP